ADGTYQLYTRATDQAGNQQAGSPLSVVVNQSAPLAVTELSAFDTPQDHDGSSHLTRAVSGDDGTADGDVVNYEIARRENGTEEYIVLNNIAAGGTNYIDGGVATGTLYDYQIIAIDLAGNRSDAVTVESVLAIDNSLPDSTPPEEVSNLT